MEGELGDADDLARWRQVHDLRKTIFGWPYWERVAPRRSNGTIKYRSADAARQRLIVTLSDQEGVSLEGVQIRITSGLLIRSEVNITFEIEHRDEWVCISRMDIWPLGPHANKHWRKLGDDPEVTGSHYHSFSQNARLGRQNFKPHSNLDSATRIDPEPDSFRDTLLLIERNWNIDGAAQLPPPELQETML